MGGQTTFTRPCPFAHNGVTGRERLHATGTLTNLAREGTAYDVRRLNIWLTSLTRDAVPISAAVIGK